MLKWSIRSHILAPILDVCIKIHRLAEIAIDRAYDIQVPWRYPIIGAVICAVLFYLTWQNYQTSDIINRETQHRIQVEHVMLQQQQIIKALNQKTTAQQEEIKKAKKKTRSNLIKLQPDQVYEVINQKMSYDSKQFNCLAKNIFFEAATESMAGKLSVAQVTDNRKHLGIWGQDYCSVVYAPAQFSWTLEKHKHIPSGPHWQESQYAAQLFLQGGYRVRPIESALFYHANYISPPWRDRHKLVAVVGHHLFYSGAVGFDYNQNFGK